MDAESIMRSTRRLLESTGTKRERWDRWQTENWEWMWQRQHEERLKPTVVAVQRFLSELLPRYEQVRDSLAGRRC